MELLKYVTDSASKSNQESSLRQPIKQLIYFF